MNIASLLRTAPRKTAITAAIAMGLMLGGINTTYAGARDQAWHLYERLTGTPPSNAMLDTMVDCINNGESSSICQNGTTVDGVTSIGISNLPSSMTTSLTSTTSHTSNHAGVVAASFLAMQDTNFLNVKVKDMVLPWTNKDQTVFFPFNDAAALLIGLIRDGTDFREALYADVYYDDPNVPSAYKLQPFVFPASNTNPLSNNNNFEYIEHKNLALNDDKNVLVRTTQTGVTGMPAEGVAGVMTTRAMQRAYFYAGTNRAMLRFTFMNFLCNDFVQIKDVTSNPDRVRQDPTRSPGGDSNVFLNKCVGCHAGMDGMAGAFAYYNWGPAVYDSTIPPDTQGSVYASSPITDGNTLSDGTPEGYVLSGKPFPESRVMPKYLQNFHSFPYGHYTTDDSWINYWRVGLDATLGWANNSPPHDLIYDPPNSNPYPSEPGNSNMGSAAQLGYELATTEAFARCQVLHVYRHVCMNDPTESQMDSMVGDFTGNNYNMLTVFSDAAIQCSGN